MSYVDLHCHSTASDGSFAPAEVVRIAKEAGVSAMSLTDHDTVAGNCEAAEEAKRQGIDFITGIEISCEFKSTGNMHLLGYGVDPNSSVLAELSRELIENRNNRNPRMIKRLNELGVSVTMEEWEQEAGGNVIGRPHLAAILVRKGYVSSIKHAFDKYLGQGGGGILRQGAHPAAAGARHDLLLRRRSCAGASVSTALRERFGT